MLNYREIKSARQWKGTIALSCVQFHVLCKAFKASFEEISAWTKLFRNKIKGTKIDFEVSPYSH